MNFINIQEIVENLKDSNGFVILVDTGRSVKVIMDDRNSLKLISHIESIIPSYSEGVDVKARHFKVNLN